MKLYREAVENALNTLPLLADAGDVPVTEAVEREPAEGLPPQPLRKLTVKSQGEDVYWLQRKLKELGYYTGTVTGSYYSGTKNAVKKFQKDHDIYPSGEADVKTQQVLYADVLEANAFALELAPETTPKPAE